MGNEIEPDKYSLGNRTHNRIRAAVMMRKIGENGGKIGDGEMDHKGKYDS